MLAICAQRIASVMRKDDLIGRFGGDEFVLMLPGVASNATLDAQMSRVNAALQQPISLSGMNVHASGSCGGALYSRDGDTFDALLEVADAQMYAAKRERANMNLHAPEVVALPVTV